MTVADARVLVVDDEPELLEIFSIWLRRSGATVLTAPNGAEALKLLSGSTVHALISDIRMPIMDGVTLVKRLHEMELTIPSIIFVSGFGDVDPRTLYSLGVEAMLPKPLGRNQLLHTLEASLREREELWISPMPAPADKKIEISLPSFAEGKAEEMFSLGRGGCCFPYPTSLPECTVDLRITFDDSEHTLAGQGLVRWYDTKSRKVGLEFCYIASESRAWLIQRMRTASTNALRSFIPFC